MMATNMFIRFESPAVTGSSTAAGHEGDIEVLSWSHGFAQPTPTPGAPRSGTVEQATHQNLTFTKYLDSATNELLKATWSGKPFGKVTLTSYRRGESRDSAPVEYLRIVMEHVIIANYSVSGGPGDVPVENIALDYGTVRYEYKDQKHENGATESSTVAHNLQTRVIE